MAFQVKVSEPSPAVTDETTGGTDFGVTLAETVEYELVPEEERKHPILGIFRSKFLGMKDTHHHGIIEAYSVNETWHLKFTDGDLVRCERTEYISNNTTSTSSDDNLDTNEWSGDNREYEYDPEEYEG